MMVGAFLATPGEVPVPVVVHPLFLRVHRYGIDNRTGKFSVRLEPAISQGDNVFRMLSSVASSVFGSEPDTAAVLVRGAQTSAVPDSLVGPAIPVRCIPAFNESATSPAFSCIRALFAHEQLSPVSAPSVPNVVRHATNKAVTVGELVRLV